MTSVSLKKSRRLSKTFNFSTSAGEVYTHCDIPKFPCKDNAFKCKRQIKIIKKAHLYSFF